MHEFACTAEMGVLNDSFLKEKKAPVVIRTRRQITKKGLMLESILNAGKKYCAYCILRHRVGSFSLQVPVKLVKPHIRSPLYTFLILIDI